MSRMKPHTVHITLGSGLGSIAKHFFHSFSDVLIVH